ncbi:hypothetical protein [Evansella halocellulosilytica]|uniref:hypothetical protein n=1 Tax=Evansella halocellulosilytica TaxID=2011013 RepID=UPI000BB921FE|nr:hypothetical protein [Evansella halocellulosilytica]
MASASHYYDLCCRHRGRVARITDRRGREYVGRIVNVDRTNVYLQPFGGSRQYGFGYGYYGGYSPVVPIALAAIGGFLVGTAFFW